MSAYAALISLNNTIHYILHSSCISHSLAPSSRQIIEVANKQLQPWAKILERLDKTSTSKSRKRINPLDGRIKETLWNFEDLLESLLSHQIVLQSGERDVIKVFSIDVQSLQDDVDSFIHKLEDMKKEYIYEVDNMAEDVDEDEEEDEDKSACIISSSTSSSAATFVETKSKMIGLSDQFEDLKRFLPVGLAWVKHIAMGLIGMAGVGKTRLAREIYEDPEIMTHFDCRLWIRVGRKSFSRENHTLEFKGDEKKCLIVLDDLWEVTGELSSFLTSIKEMKNMHVRILFTARVQKVRDYVSRIIPDTIGSLFVRFLKEEESKELLRDYDCHTYYAFVELVAGNLIRVHILEET